MCLKGRKVHQLNKMGKKAKIFVDPMEQEYVKKYGRLPDHDFADFYNQYGSVMAGKIIQERMDGIYKDLYSPEFRPASDSPFQKSDNRTNGAQRNP